MVIRYEGLFAALQGCCSFPSLILSLSSLSRYLSHYRPSRPDCSGTTLPKSSSKLHQKIPQMQGTFAHCSVR
ncbi:hypothetical protein BKA82DRAFT_510691 [Pisolithus tinctorius]|uniref:Uncharacterized protein n=1 Tax=Pisolithus tinctorius Marx 270 TaxID=870435 RepID=A0A0C3J6X2_PISTI|nr:hypothetical protein BKA82DRAFT_510691 [Pisolithus tinctorius]KIN93431.1 hypothetical protein M404DRAFT_510691 [Pisolithus tinctorius Marx 270]